MRNIKAASITLLLSFAVIFSCFSGCGEEIYDLAKLANEGIPIASILIFDGTSHFAVITDGNDYFKVISLTGFTTPGTSGMTVDNRGCFHVYNVTNIYTYKRDGTYSISDTFTNVYGIAAGNDKVYAMVFISPNYYIYQYDTDTGQWTNSGIDLSATSGNFLLNCLVRDNATGNVYLADNNDPIATFYRLPGLEILGSASGENTSFYSVYENEGFVFSGTYGICSTQRGTLATPAFSLLFTVMDSNNIFYGDLTGTIFRYNSVMGLTSKSVSFPHAPTQIIIIALDDSRIIMSEYGATTCDIILYNYDTEEIIKTIYSFTTPGSGGAVWDSVYR